MTAQLAVPATVGYPARRPFLLLAGWFFLGAMQMALIAARPPHPGTHTELLFWLAGGFAALGCASLLLGPHLGLAFHVALVTCAILVPIGVTAIAVSGQGQLMSGVFLIVVGAYAGYFLPRPVAMSLLTLIVVAYAVAVAFVPLLDSMAYVVFLEGSIIAITLVIASLSDHLRALVVHDPLTGALNRRGLEPLATHAHDLDVRLHKPTVLVEIDLDGFKLYNDRYGHIAGDELLRSTVVDWQCVLRSTDVLARTGGDEFVLVLPDTTEAQAQELLARLRGSNQTKWTAGLTVWSPEERLFGALAHADADLYAHKPMR